MKLETLTLIFIIAISVIVGLMLVALPLPNAISSLRPAWIALIVMSWAMLLPHKFSLGWAWFIGLFMDVLQGGLLGQHALALAVITYIIVKWQVRLRLLPLRQQSLFILLFLIIYQILISWPQIILHQSANSWLIWCSPFVGMALWPWVFYFLQAVQSRLSE